MDSSLWQSSEHEWAVCDGPGLLDVCGYITDEGGAWRIVNSNIEFLDQLSAANKVLGRQFPLNVKYHLLELHGKNRAVLADPDVLEKIVAKGWRLVATFHTLAGLKVSNLPLVKTAEPAQ
jgi:hypothetical protein